MTVMLHTVAATTRRIIALNPQRTTTGSTEQRIQMAVKQVAVMTMLTECRPNSKTAQCVES